MTTKIPDRLDREVHAHKFGAIEFRTQGAGLFFPSEKLKARISELSRDQLEDANRAAWKVRRTAERALNRYRNDPHMDNWDRTSHTYHVAEQICKTTWAALKA